MTRTKGIYIVRPRRPGADLNIRRLHPEPEDRGVRAAKGHLPCVEEHFELEQMEADHVTPWHAGRPTSAANCQMLCKADNRAKSGV